MRRLSLILIAAALTAAGFLPAAHAELVTSTPAAAIDNIPPAPITALQAVETASSGTSRTVSLTWVLSADDAVSYTAFGSGYVPRGGVRGYRVYRTAVGGQAVLLATLGPGVTAYTDQQVTVGERYSYAVHPFDQDNESAFVAAPGSAEDLSRWGVVGGLVEPEPEVSVRARIAFAASLDLQDAAAVSAYSARFVTRLAELLGITASRISVAGITGSAVVEFTVAEPVSGSSEPAAAALLTTLAGLAGSPSEPFGDLGPALSLTDASAATETSLLVRPIGVDGRPILGWFTREGTSVGFDDFFLFADHFGLSEGAVAYDPIFDIIVNETIDFEDFFRFADDFGKVVTNADAVTGR
ncbi:MAG: hypothetical protein WDA75_15275 [Candidatus Latescibacterota bacterium]|jgi:hypothetical protein